MRDQLLSDFATEDLPSNTYDGDGEPIPPAALEDLRAAYLRERVVFQWQAGDLLMLDNLMTAHSRESFVGRREVVVGMSEPCQHTGAKI